MTCHTPPSPQIVQSCRPPLGSVSVCLSASELAQTPIALATTAPSFDSAASHTVIPQTMTSESPDRDVDPSTSYHPKKRAKYTQIAWFVTFAPFRDLARSCLYVLMLTMVAMSVNGAKSSVAVDRRVHGVPVGTSPAVIPPIAYQSKKPSSKMHGRCSLQNTNKQATITSD